MRSQHGRTLYITQKVPAIAPSIFLQLTLSLPQDLEVRVKHKDRHRELLENAWWVEQGYIIICTHAFKANMVSKTSESYSIVQVEHTLPG